MTTATAHFIRQVECCLHGYHVYWYLTMGEVLSCSRAGEYARSLHYGCVGGRYACCVVGNLPHLISRECYFFFQYSHHRLLSGSISIISTSVSCRLFLGPPGPLFARFLGSSALAFQCTCIGEGASLGEL